MTFDQISQFPGLRVILQEVPRDLGSLVTYRRVWVTFESIQGEFIGGSFDSICEQPPEVNDLALKGSNGYLSHKHTRAG